MPAGELMDMYKKPPDIWYRKYCSKQYVKIEKTLWGFPPVSVTQQTFNECN